MREESNRGIRKYTLAAALVAASAAALGSFTFAICPDCNRQIVRPDVEVPKDPEKTPEPKQETSRGWRTIDS